MSKITDGNRRNFIKKTIIATVGLAAGASGVTANAKPNTQKSTMEANNQVPSDMRIIDFRCRPPITPQKLLFDIKLQRQKWKNQMINLPLNDVSPSMHHVGDAKGLTLLMDEMNKSGISHIIMPGRNLSKMPKAALSLSDATSINVTDDMLLSLVKKFDNRATGLHGINLSNIDKAVKDIEKAVTKYKMPGAVLEAGYQVDEKGDRLQLSHKSLYPIYETMVSTDSVLMIQSGIYAGPDIGANDWAPLDVVLQDFPKLKVVLAHGGYPRIIDALALAAKHPNFYLSPDIYCFFPGGSLYVESIKIIPDQMLFASAYPFGSLAASVESSLKFDLPDDVMKRYMGENAARLLNI